MAVSNGCLFFALYTLVPTFAQTTTSETRAVERSQSARESDSQPVSTPPSATEQAQQTQQFIEERLAVWRQRLKLEEWRISVVMTRRGDLKPKTLGGTRWDKNQKSAVIWVLDPCDYRLPFSEMMGDMEMTVVPTS